VAIAINLDLGKFVDFRFKTFFLRELQPMTSTPDEVKLFIIRSKHQSIFGIGGN